MDEIYKGKYVLVTGASRGVGALITQHFLTRGALVLGLSKGASSLTHENYTHYQADLSKPEEIISCFRQIAKAKKKIDIVINNAAVLTSQYSMIMPVKNAIEMVNIDLLGVFFVSREAAKLMRGNTYGRIINISSMATRLEPIGDSIYAACKTAINTLANVMAKEFSPLNITCNTVAITAIETDMLNQLPRHKIDDIIKNLTIPRYALPDDIFNVIDFFASDRSSYITSQIIYLGGLS